MYNSFVSKARETGNRTVTENGANSYKSTGDSLVDLFGVIGSLRTAEPQRIERLFASALAEDKLLAMKLLFYARNIRGLGLGERRTFRVILNYLATVYPVLVTKNIHNIPYYGRWDDLWDLDGTVCEDAMYQLVKDQWKEDLANLKKGKPVSIMAKWIPMPNTRSKDPMADKIMKKLGYKIYREYKTKLHELRMAIDVVEIKMSEGRWSEIDFEKVPSRAMKNYRKAFERHGAQFAEYIKKVEKGEAKIQASTLYPYDIFKSMTLEWPVYSWGGRADNHFYFKKFDKVAEEQWKALPNYVGDGGNILVVADTSGSMSSFGGLPINISLSLAMYFAERNHGPFKNLFMTFSSEPRFVTLKGETLYDRIKCVESIVDSTNLEAAFDLTLDTAVSAHVPAEDMPKAIVVISDNEIDSFEYSNHYWGFLETMKEKFRRYGYEMPNVVMWNVASRHDSYLAKSDFQGVQFASGASASTFKALLANMGVSARELALNTLNDPIFDRVVI